MVMGRQLRRRKVATTLILVANSQSP